MIAQMLVLFLLRIGVAVEKSTRVGRAAARGGERGRGEYIPGV